jgi:hypothetical protein
MFVTPHNEVKEVGEEVLREVIRVTMGVVILMDSHQVKPILLLHTRFIELDVVISKGSEKSLVSHVTQPV